jgi:hypothetical protein
MEIDRKTRIKKNEIQFHPFIPGIGKNPGCSEINAQ